MLHWQGQGASSDSQSMLMKLGPLPFPVFGLHVPCYQCIAELTAPELGGQLAHYCYAMLHYGCTRAISLVAPHLQVKVILLHAVTVAVACSLFAVIGVQAKVIYSGGEDLDILPQHASKGKGLEFLLAEVSTIMHVCHVSTDLINLVMAAVHLLAAIIELSYSPARLRPQHARQHLLLKMARSTFGCQ